MRNRKGGRRLPGITSIMMVAGLIIFTIVLMNMGVSFALLLDTIYMDLSLTLPTFDYSFEDGIESGNETFDTYILMRYIGGGVIGMVMVYAGVSRVMESELVGLTRLGTSNRVLGNAMIFMVIILVFPPIWDSAAVFINNVSLWVLNPDYAFDTAKPCQPEWYDDEYVIFEAFNGSPYRSGWTNSPDTQENSLVVAESVCKPEFKVRYVFKQVVGTTEVNELESQYKNEGDTFGDIFDGLRTFSHEQFTNIFLGVAKAMISLTLLVSVFLIGIMADVFIGVLLAALPFLLFLSLLPKIDKVAKTFLEALPILFLLPLLSAAVLVVGAGFVAGLGVDCSYYDDCEPVAAFDEVTDTATYVWISALAVVFLAVSLPVILVPSLLGQPVKMAERQVQSGIHTAAMVTGSAMAGMVGGGRSGLSAGAGRGTLARLGMMAGAGATGLGHGMLSGGSQATAPGLGDSGALPSGKDREHAAKGLAQEGSDAQGARMFGDMKNSVHKWMHPHGSTPHMPSDMTDGAKGRRDFAGDPARQPSSTPAGTRSPFKQDVMGGRTRQDGMGRTDHGGTPPPSGPSLPGSGPPDNSLGGGQDYQRNEGTTVANTKSTVQQLIDKVRGMDAPISGLRDAVNRG